MEAAIAVAMSGPQAPVHAGGFLRSVGATVFASALILFTSSDTLSAISCARGMSSASTLARPKVVKDRRSTGCPHSFAQRT